MKKTYIEPKNTVVHIKLETMIAESISGVNTESISGFGGMGSDTGGTITDAEGREVINTPDAWEEW